MATVDMLQESLRFSILDGLQVQTDVIFGKQADCVLGCARCFVALYLPFSNRRAVSHAFPRRAWERLKQVEIDLDDGVKVNYPKFGKTLKKVPGLS